MPRMILPRDKASFLSVNSDGGDVPLERRASNRKVAKPWFDSRFPILGPSSLPVVVAQPDEISESDMLTSTPQRQ